MMESFIRNIGTYEKLFLVNIVVVRKSFLRSKVEMRPEGAGAPQNCHYCEETPPEQTNVVAHSTDA